MKIILLFALALPLMAQTCTITAFPVQVMNGQVVCPTVPIPPTPSSCSYCNPASVLVIEQGNSGPEPGTGTTDASHWVAMHYMALRGIPAQNLLRIFTYIDSCGSPGCPFANMAHGDSTNLGSNNGGNGMVLFNTLIAPQVKAKIAALASSGTVIKYLVPVYGIPITIAAGSSPCLYQSCTIAVDSALAMLNLPPQSFMAQNPYYSGVATSSPPHIDISTSGVLLVSRLDAPTAVLAAGLVDKAIAGETAGVKGIGYFDYSSNGTPLGSTMVNAAVLCKMVVPTQTCNLNDQAVTGHMIQSAPNTAWAWGGYDLGQANAGVYGFVPGAVATQMNSNSAQTVRRFTTGAVVYTFLLNGVTSTWGAVNEPYTSGYANGDNLLSHLWRGYTFGESAYIASPALNWMMVFLGDPLYRPKILQGL